MNEQGLCWVQLKEDKLRGLVLERCHFEPLAPGCIADGQIVEFGEVETALGRLFRVAEVGKKPGMLPLALAIPALLVTIASERFPAALKEAALFERVQADIAVRMRRSPDELCVDYMPDTAPAAFAPDLKAERDWLTASVPKEAVEDRIALIESAGLPLHPVAMTVSTQAAVLAACRAVQARSDAVMAVAQIDGGWLQLDIVQYGDLLHSERLPLAQPWAGTVDGSQDRGPQLPDGLSDALNACYGAGGTAPLQQLWLVCPPAEAAAWANALQQRTGLTCTLINPFETMVTADAKAGRPMPDASHALLACGLALVALEKARPTKRGEQRVSFNFLPHRKVALAQRQRTFMRQLGAVAFSVLLASAAMRVALSDKLVSAQATQVALKQEIATLDAEIKRVGRFADEKLFLQGYQAVLTSFSQGRQQTPLMLQELSAMLPEGLHLTSLRRDPLGDINLSGQASSAAEVFLLIERLSGSHRYFKRPALLELSMVDAVPIVTAPPGTSVATLVLPTAPLMPAVSLMPSTSQLPPTSQIPLIPPMTISQVLTTERVVFSLRAEQP